MELFNHPRAWEAVLVARLLSIRIPRVKSLDPIAFMYKLGLDEFTAGNRPALSKHSYCVGCDTLVTSSTAVPVVMHRRCENCAHLDLPVRTSPLYYDMHSRFLQLDPEVQVLALEYLSLRKQYGTTTRSYIIEDGQSSGCIRQGTD